MTGLYHEHYRNTYYLSIYRILRLHCCPQIMGFELLSYTFQPYLASHSYKGGIILFFQLGGRRGRSPQLVAGGPNGRVRKT